MVSAIECQYATTTWSALSSGSKSFLPFLETAAPSPVSTVRFPMGGASKENAMAAGVSSPTPFALAAALAVKAMSANSRPAGAQMRLPILSVELSIQTFDSHFDSHLRIHEGVACQYCWSTLSSSACLAEAMCGHSGVNSARTLRGGAGRTRGGPYTAQALHYTAQTIPSTAPASQDGA